MLQAPLLWIVTVATLMLQSGEKPPSDDPAASVVYQAGKAYVPIRVPRPIDAECQERLAAILNLSDMQRPIMAALIEAALDEDSRIRERALSNLMPESERLGALGIAVTQDLQHADAHALFIDGCQKLIVDLGTNENSLFSRLAEVLADVQQPALERARQFRERQRWAVMLRYRFSSRVDLSDVVYRLQREQAMACRDTDAFDTLLKNYEVALTHLAHRHAETQFKVMRETPRLLAMGAGVRDPGMRERLQRAVNSQEERIGDLNKVYVSLLSELLEQADAQRLVQAYCAKAYPEVLPNPYDPSEVWAVAANYTSAEKRGLLMDIVHRLREKHDVASDRMQRRVDEWMNRYPTSGGYRPEDFDEYSRELDELQAQRKTATEAALSELLTLFDQNPPAEVARALSDYRHTIERRRGKAMGITYIP